MAEKEGGCIQTSDAIFRACIIEFHYTPKHASWLNTAEIEINVMDIECTDRRIGDLETLAREVAAWTKRRNDQKKKINWKFTRDKANKKLSKYYV